MVINNQEVLFWGTFLNASFFFLPVEDGCKPRTTMYYLLHTMYYLVENYCLRYLSTYIGYFMLTFSLTIFLLLLAVPNFRASLYFTTYVRTVCHGCPLIILYYLLMYLLLSTMHYTILYCWRRTQNALPVAAGCVHACMLACEKLFYPSHPS